MWQKPFYVVHVYAIVLLKLVHPEGDESSGRDGTTEGQSIIGVHTAPLHEDSGRSLISPLSVDVRQVLWRSSQVFPVEVAEVKLLRLHVPTSAPTTQRRKSRQANVLIIIIPFQRVYVMYINLDSSHCELIFHSACTRGKFVQVASILCTQQRQRGQNLLHSCCHSNLSSLPFPFSFRQVNVLLGE